ncbi:MAG: GNAT family N-acetyltransferase [Actinomycetes bacterium]
MSTDAHAEVTLRPASDADERLLDELFATTRGAELAGLPVEMRASFVAMQRMAQERAWSATFPALERSIVVVDGSDAGRLYVDHGRDVTVVDLTLLPSVRGRGVGTRLLTELQDAAAGGGANVMLSVEPDNPAQRLYQRLGFVAHGGDALRIVMRWPGN